VTIPSRPITSDGDPVQVVGAGNLARCLQHETDHLDGVLFIDRMDRQRRKAAMRAIRDAEWNHLVPPKVKLSPHPIVPEGVSP
jgi:peptide deformylase